MYALILRTAIVFVGLLGTPSAVAMERGPMPEGPSVTASSQTPEQDPSERNCAGSFHVCSCCATTTCFANEPHQTYSVALTGALVIEPFFAENVLHARTFSGKILRPPIC